MYHNGVEYIDYDDPEPLYDFASRPPLTVEVTRRYVIFIREHKSTAYEPSRPSYDRLANLANSGAYEVEILPASHGVAWTMRRKGIVCHE